jgi:cell wall-associated NlpC family hydrolase
VRRASLLAVVLCVLVAGGAGLALGASGQPSSPPAARATATAAAAGAAQPPLPAARPKVVQPVAGRTAGVADAAMPAAHDAATDRAPTRPASAARARARAGGARQGAGKDPVHDATALPNGVALPPLEAPEAVMQIIEAGNVIARSPYRWGGGHGKWQDTGYDCSGSVSYALAAAGLLGGPLASGPLMSWGAPGRGKWVTIFANDGHVYMEVAGLRFDTSGARVTGSRWQSELRSGAGFTLRHPPGL